MADSLSLSTFEKEAATSGLNFVAGFGALLVSGNVLDRIGRRWTIMTASLLLLCGAVVVSTASSFPMLLAGRALQGLGSGCSWAACSVYITELAPTE
jgi:MFS family permease